MTYSPKLQGTALIIAAVAFFSVTSLLSKHLSNGLAGSAGVSIHPLQISGCRFVFGFLTIALVVFFKPISFAGVAWPLHIGRSVTGLLGISGVFAAINVLPIAEVLAISFLNVIFFLPLAVLVLKEQVGWIRWSAAFVALFGALIIAQPVDISWQPATLFALGAALFIAVETLFIKLLSDREHFIVILFINNAIGAMLSLMIAPWFWQLADPRQWVFLAAVGIIMVLAQALNILALQRCQASYLSPFWLSTPLFGAVYDYLIFDDIISTQTSIGILLIIIAGVIISRRSSS